ncbi:hypothetical protein EV284_1437 [Streptomyces sp. BK022]|uniref:hypothetical protein n=1 Tax=Streptomyces sp. BK022 TaxID=2512123 RepID=UPI001029AB57|nr:hypothetical protein [Streptomyces sp. BK022]RZU43981.1 hypothetical protein EV284_1437 [Streptomyces sp. BK022]
MRRGARPARRAARAVALASAALLLTGCAQSVDPIERLGKKAAQGVRRPAPVRPLSVRTGTRAVDHVATTDRVVFLTYDAGAVRDRRLAALIGELRLPVTVFTRAEAPVHWRARTTRHGLAYKGTPGHLTPGDIIRITPGREGTLAERTEQVLREAGRRGLTPGKLKDYL